MKKLQYRAIIKSTQKTVPYLPSEGLINAVNLTIFLEKRPLLIKGEPGCGKTRLAMAVASELNLPYESWYIKSTSKAKEGLYFYDTIRRLHDAQLAKTNKSSININNLDNYIKLGPLGRAFKNKKRTVVLIDEIDKADIDFPNDLLLEIDEQKFLIEETGETILANQPPIVFITSNDEKELPEAFLRRCLFFYIEFPDYEQMNEIVKAHFPDRKPGTLKAIVERFMILRGEMNKHRDRVIKKVSTSELLDWVTVLARHQDDEILSMLGGNLPYAEVLLKNWDDHIRFVGKTDIS